MTRSTLNLAMAAVLAGLVGAVWFNQHQTEMKAKKAAHQGPPLTAMKRDAVTQILLQHAGKPDIALAKKDGHWMLTAPVQARADDVEVGNLLAFADTPTRSDLDPAQVKLTDLGLAPPAYTLKLNDTEIAVGGTEPIKYLRYVERDPGRPGAEIHLIDDIGGGATDADYSDLVDRNLLPAKAEIASIEVPGLTVKRSADGKGWTATPDSPAATSDAVQEFVDHWRAAQALSMSPVVVPGTGDDLATVTLTDGTARHYRIVKRDPQLVFEDDALKVRYHLGHEDIATLLALPRPKPKAPAAPAKHAAAPAAKPAVTPPSPAATTPKTGG